MNSSGIARFAALASSVTLLTCYVVYSHRSAKPLEDHADTETEWPQPKTPSPPPDPIAALAATDSRPHQMQPALADVAVGDLHPPGSAEPLWKSPMNARVLGDHGNGPENSERMTTPAKLAAKYFHRSRQIMPGSKSAAVFAPPLAITPSNLPPELEIFRFESPARTEFSTGLPLLTDQLTWYADALPPDPPGSLEQPQNIQRILANDGRETRPQPDSLQSSTPPDPLEQPTNIQRILADDGHSADESRKAIAPARLAEVRLYEQTPVPVYTGMWFGQRPKEVPDSVFYRPLFQLLTPLTINEPPTPSLHQDSRLPRK
ncbi:hypothetical protein [Prosthecobacter sp.]|uniref:hypothetical protein n=1 Tax=Prosthecobacter sp. TaxID=1965333 RepID=UPI003784DD99